MVCKMSNIQKPLLVFKKLNMCYNNNTQNPPRPAFIFSMAVMFGMSLLWIVAFMAVISLFTLTIVPTIPDVLTDIPTLYDYDENGKRIEGTAYNSEMDSGHITEQVSLIQAQNNDLESQMSQAVQNNDWNKYNELKSQKETLNQELESLDFGIFVQPNQRLELYWMFAIPSVITLSFFVLFAFVAYYWEKAFSIFKKGTSTSILKNSILGIFVVLLLPEFWDTYAIMMKQFSLYLLDPFGGNPHVTTERLWCKMGCIVNTDRLLDQNVWATALTNPSNFGQELLTNALLPLFKTIPVAILSITLFVIAKIRVLFIMIVLITIPIWMVCMNLPFLKKHANDMISNMIGASIAPVFSALTLFVGLTYVDSSPIPALEEWISVLAIGIFAALWPVILAPKLSVIASQTAGIVHTAMNSTAMLTQRTASQMGDIMAREGMFGESVREVVKGNNTNLPTTTSHNTTQQIPPMAIPSESENVSTNTNTTNTSSGHMENNSVQKISDSYNPQISNGVMNNPGPALNSMLHSEKPR